MRTWNWILPSVLSVVSVLALSISDVSAQLRPSTPPSPAPPPQAAPAQRTEILSFDNWQVTCQDATATTRKTCSAALQLAQQQSGGTRNVVFSLVLALDGQQRLMALIQTPTGINLTSGIELTLGQRPVRRIAYTSCEPQRCDALVQMDDAFQRELASAEQGGVVVTGTNGQQVRFELQLRGAARALALVRQP